ncbi:MAG: glycosyl hydrolase family 57 [Candidatus Omnitrophica bacterium]|nr:glycosyl hydrolase family 57 [Candidatus Omnitrophota bacterium]
MSMKKKGEKMSDIINGLPNICGLEKQIIPTAVQRKKKYYSNISNLKFSNINSSFGIALHMHQPSIPASSDDIWNSSIISNLQHMFEHQGIGDNHNAGVFMQCYKRLSWIVPNLVSNGKNPRVMLDYSGNLFWGLRQMENGSALEDMKRVTCDQNFRKNFEWLGTMWSHAVASSTPVPDIKLHILAWRNHFASIFGEEEVRRVKGFSPPEMHLPIHPDVCYEYIKALKECGYEWLMVQEHSIENMDGSGIRRQHFPHTLVAKNSEGKVEEITVLIKTQGSDTKLVAQMQPYYEAKGLARQDYADKNIPPFVCQIGDGENGGVMMNEFPPGYDQAYNQIGYEGTVGLNGSEYLEFLQDNGIDESKFIKVQPVSQNRIWKEINGKYAQGAADKAIDQIKTKDHGYNLDKGSWTSDRSWTKGYEHVLDPINQLSAAFHEKCDNITIDPNSHTYREALLYLLLSQTSCFRYWGAGIWTEYAKEICRRGFEALKKI